LEWVPVRRLLKSKEPQTSAKPLPQVGWLDFVGAGPLGKNCT
jgi:hypothetical protein